MSQFRMDDYVDVAERIREFSKRYPDGCLQAELSRLEGGWFARAYAYRTPDDTKPGIGHAFEPVPGKTPYTKDSEAMNAETSAWGRAIVALGFDTKKIASAQEVRARQDSAPPRAAQPKPPAKSQPQTSPPAAGSPSNGEFVFPSGKHQGKPLAEVDAGYLDWYLGAGPRDDVKDAIRAFRGEPSMFSDEDVPF